MGWGRDETIDVWSSDVDDTVALRDEDGDSLWWMGHPLNYVRRHRDEAQACVQVFQRDLVRARPAARRPTHLYFGTLSFWSSQSGQASFPGVVRRACRGRVCMQMSRCSPTSQMQRCSRCRMCVRERRATPLDPARRWPSWRRRDGRRGGRAVSQSPIREVGRDVPRDDVG